jgi:hypothetical protein
VLTARALQASALCLFAAGPLLGQAVQGRVLVHSADLDVAQSATTASGGFSLKAPRAGSYRVFVRQIGRRTWRSQPMALAAGALLSVVLRVQAEPYELPTLTVEARQPRCGIRLGDDHLVTRLLEAAQTALALAEATAEGGRVAFSSENYLARYTPKLAVTDSSSTGVGRFAAWPIQSAPPDSLHEWGFVRTSRPGEGWTDVGGGPVYFGLDARVLFSDWFLAEHCFQLEAEEAGELRVRFTPAERVVRSEVEGHLVLDRASLELRRIEFAYVGLPRWVPRGLAGGEVRLRRLSSGAWVPYAWRVRAPVARVVTGRIQPQLEAWVETGGRVRSVRGPGGRVDTLMTRELLGPS